MFDFKTYGVYVWDTHWLHPLLSVFPDSTQPTLLSKLPHTRGKPADHGKLVCLHRVSQYLKRGELRKVLTHFRRWNYQRDVLRQKKKARSWSEFVNLAGDAGLRKAWVYAVTTRTANQWSSPGACGSQWAGNYLTLVCGTHPSWDALSISWVAA